MSFQDKVDVRSKAVGEGVAPAIREAFAQLFLMLPITSTTVPPTTTT